MQQFAEMLARSGLFYGLLPETKNEGMREGFDYYMDAVAGLMQHAHNARL